MFLQWSLKASELKMFKGDQKSTITKWPMEMLLLQRIPQPHLRQAGKVHQMQELQT